MVLTHHHLKNRGKQAMALNDGEGPKIGPITEAGSGSVQEKEKALLRDIIKKVNELFGADTTDGDQLVYVSQVILGKLCESETLKQQAKANSKEQFANSPDLSREILDAIMSAYEAHTSLSKQALNSETVRDGLKNILISHAGLYEKLNELAGGDTAA